MQVPSFLRSDLPVIFKAGIFREWAGISHAGELLPG